MFAGSGLCIAMWAISAWLALLMIEIELSKRVGTYRRPCASSITIPVGPPPDTGIWLAVLGTKVSFSSAWVLNTPTLLDPRAATYSVWPSLEMAIPWGRARLLTLSAFGTGAQQVLKS